MSSKLKAALIAVGVTGAALAARAMRQSVRLSEPSPSAAASQHAAPNSPPSGTAQPDLEGATRAELYEEAKRRRIPGRSRMSKADLRTALDRSAS